MKQEESHAKFESAVKWDRKGENPESPFARPTKKAKVNWFDGFLWMSRSVISIFGKKTIFIFDRALKKEKPPAPPRAPGLLFLNYVTLLRNKKHIWNIFII